MITTSSITPELFAALAAAQGELVNADKTSTNPHFRSKYADLAEVLNTIRPVFAKHGLSIVQSPSFDGQCAHVTTLLAHKSGGYLTDKASCVPGKTDGQGIGAATTYLRRYAAAAFAGIAQEDDDGESAKHSTPPSTSKPVAPAGPKPATPAAAPKQHNAPPPVIGVTTFDTFIIDSKEVTGTTAKGPWTLWVFTLANGIECKTFNQGIAQQALALVDDQARNHVQVEVGPGRKEGSVELLSVMPADDIPT